MGELATVVFDHEWGASEFQDRVSSMEAAGDVTVFTGAHLHRQIDDRLRLDRTMGRPGDADYFWGLFVGLLIWPQWVAAGGPGMSELPLDVLARLDDWAVPLDWANEVCQHLRPGNRAVLLMVERLPVPLLDAVRATRGDLFRVSLPAHSQFRLCQAFGG